jgi:hypothetical protein
MDTDKENIICYGIMIVYVILLIHFTQMFGQKPLLSPPCFHIQRTSNPQINKNKKTQLSKYLHFTN